MKQEDISIRESQIEDVFASYPDLLKETLDCKNEIALIGRQKILPSGNKLDLILASGHTILLVELKVGRFKKEHLDQIRSYALELRTLQSQKKFVPGEIASYLLCTAGTSRDTTVCAESGVCLRAYSPEIVLEHFFARLKALASFIELKPTNHGLWNLHLLNRILYVLDTPKKVSELSALSKLSRSTVASYSRLAEELLLVSEQKGVWSLTESGRQFVWSRDASAPDDSVSDEQTRALQRTVIENPFGSGAILGMYTVVESVFDLAKNTYPVPERLLSDYFRLSAGRYFEWRTSKTAKDSLRMFSNYVIDLGLIGRIGSAYYITPDGIRFILMLNLHKSLKIIDALGISRSSV